MAKYGYLVVEGPHDVEFVARLLHPFGLRRVVHEDHLDEFFVPLIPRTYPPNGDLQKRVPVPLFLQSDSHIVAVHSAIGDTRLAQSIEETAVRIDFSMLTGAGVLIDSDSLDAQNRFSALRDALFAQGFELPDGPGSVSETAPRRGAFVLPDNETNGTLEHLLIECARHHYKGLLESAEQYVKVALQDTTLLAEDISEIRKPSGKNKATVGAIASILRPGRAIQVSIQDNRWLRDTSLALPKIKAVQDFLCALLDLE